MQEETKPNLDRFHIDSQKYKVREGISTKEEKSNQCRVVFFGKQKKNRSTCGNT